MTKSISYKRLFIILILLPSFLPKSILAQKDSLRLKIEQIIRSSEGNVGVAIMGLEDNDTLTSNGNRHFPMQSVYKFPLALAVLNQVDKGKLSLNQKIYIKKKHLHPDTWSPLREKYPNGNIDITLNELLSYTVSQSDNNGCDILFGLLGGTKKVEAYIHSLGIKGIAIAATEEQMHKDWEVQFTNWSEPIAMLSLLDIFFRRKNLSNSNSDFLLKIMTETSTGPNRIKGLLPTGTIVAHKTGSSGTNEKGIAAATNDVGIVTLPNNKHFAIVIFISNSTENDEIRDRVIAKITKAAWDYFTAKE
jgi:beta-lactamase class A